MELKRAEKTGTNLYELEFSIAPATIKEAISTVYRRDAKKYNVPGFRKGKAPRNLIEKMYGEDVFMYDAVNDIFPAEYELAVKEAGIEPVATPDVELVSATMGDGAVLKAKVTVKPEMKVGKYTGLKATKTAQTVDEAQVDEEIKRLQDRNARLVTREGAAEQGDVAEIDFEGFVDEVAFEGGKGQGHKLTLGSGQFIPGFEEQVVGHSAGEEFDVNVTFPTEYHAEDLAGKEAVFKVKLNGLQYQETDALDDEFAKDVSEFDTLEELKKSIRDKQQAQLDEQADLETENMLVDQIVETLEGEIPEAMFENRIDETVRDFSFRLENQGLNLDTYMQYTGMDAASFREGFREQAVKQVKIRLALETIVKLEKIEISEDDITKEIERIAEKYQMEAEQVRNLMPVEEISKDLAVNKAIDLIKTKATITAKKPSKKAAADEKEPKAEKPAKKAAPKAKAKAKETKPKEATEK